MTAKRIDPPCRLRKRIGVDVAHYDCRASACKLFRGQAPHPARRTSQDSCLSSKVYRFHDYPLSTLNLSKYLTQETIMIAAPISRSAPEDD